MADLVGRILQGRYRIEELVGRGGMAEVYKAWDTWRNYHVAIKVMREDLAEDLEFVRRFRREAQALAGLAHENIVRFYSFEREDLLTFIVMDYVEGTTLRSEIARSEGPLPLEQVLSVTKQVCAALHYAHLEGVIHRDVKPGNIMIQPDPLTGASGRVLLSDFGIAKAANAATATTVMPGTPAYMSPEQCRSEPLDVRTDVYSLGVVVYEMLAGRRPFVGEIAPETVTGGTRERVRWEQMHAAPPPLQRHNPSLPRRVEKVVLKALAKKREERWPTALAFWQALAKALGPVVSKAAIGPVIRAVPVSESGAAASEAEAEERAKPEPQPALPVPPAEQGMPAAVPAYRRVLGWVWVVGALAVVGGIIVLLAGRGRAMLPLTATPCSQTVTLAPTATPRPPTATLAPTATSRPPTATPIPTRTRRPTSTPTPTATPVPASAILYSEDFEDGVTDGWTTYAGAWSVVEDGSNHFWRGTGPTNYPQAWLDVDYTNWTNYAFESRIRFVKGAVFVCVRTDGGSAFYNAYISSSDDWISFADYDGSLYRTFGDIGHSVRINKWYTVRFEVEGDRLRLYIDNHLITAARRSSREHGGVGYYMGGGEEIHFDDIRIWALTP